MAKDKVKLLLNMVTLALAALPRGGALRVSITGEPESPAFEVRCEGDASRVPEVLADMLSGNNDHALDAHSIQPYYAIRVAAASGMSLKAEKDGESVVMTAT